MTIIWDVTFKERENLLKEGYFDRQRVEARDYKSAVAKATKLVGVKGLVVVSVVLVAAAE